MGAIKTAVYGANGKMGQLLCKTILASEDFELSFGVDRAPDRFDYPYPIYENAYAYEGKIDLLIDFSHASNIESILDFTTSRGIHTLIATTGLTDEHMVKIREASKKIPILCASNLSFGINVITRLLSQVAKSLNEGFDIEIIEKHHNKKIDAPSGTAYLLANTINHALGDTLTLTYGRHGSDCPRKTNEIGIHTVRGGSISGEHTILFAGEQELIEIKHTALSKDLFAQDALKAGKLLLTKPAGLYTMQDLLE